MRLQVASGSLLFACLVSIAAALASPADSSGTLVCRVVSADGRAIENAIVLIVGTKISGLADRAGIVRIPSVPAGVYTIRARRIDYVRRDSAGVQIDPGDTRYVDFRLVEVVTRIYSLPVTSGSPAPARETNANVPDSTIQFSIRSSVGKAVRPGNLIEVAIYNAGRDTVILPLPGDGSFEGWRTPLLGWEIREAGGPLLKQEPVGRCGNINPLYPNEVFQLPPGKTRTFGIVVPVYYVYEKLKRYQFRLSYENRPDMDWGLAGETMGHDPEALRLLRRSTPGPSRLVEVQR